MNYNRYPKRDAVKNYFPLPNEIFSLGLSGGEILVYTHRFLVQPYHLLLVAILHRFLNRADGIEQIAVALFAFLCDDGGRLGCNQSFLNQTVHIFFHGIVAHTNRFADGFVTWVALKCFPIFTVHKMKQNAMKRLAEYDRKHPKMTVKTPSLEEAG